MLDTVLGEENMVIKKLLHTPAYHRAPACGGQEHLAPLQQLPSMFSLPSFPFHSRGSIKSGQDCLPHRKSQGISHMTTRSAASSLPQSCLDGMETGCALCICTDSLSTLLILHIFSPVQLIPSPVSEDKVPRTGPFSTSTNMLGFDCGNKQVAWFKLLNSVESFPQSF